MMNYAEKFIDNTLSFMYLIFSIFSLCILFVLLFSFAYYILSNSSKKNNKKKTIYSCIFRRRTAKKECTRHSFFISLFYNTSFNTESPYSARLLSSSPVPPLTTSPPIMVSPTLIGTPPPKITILPPSILSTP